jgi:hypothetical protein
VSSGGNGARLPLAAMSAIAGGRGGLQATRDEREQQTSASSAIPTVEKHPMAGGEAAMLGPITL